MTYTLPLPVEGWVRACASYTTSIVRSVVTALRDDGPLTALQTLGVVKQSGIGADVAKASPDLNAEDGAQRIVNLLTIDIDVIHTEANGLMLSVDSTVTVAQSAITGTLFNLPFADELVIQREASRRQVHLRRWMTTFPFRSAWRNGVRTHTDEEIVALADLISTIGYVGPPIVRDQDGAVIDGALRIAALTKLGIDADKFTEWITFSSDMERLAWVIAAHYREGRDGNWPKSLREAIVKMVNASCRHSGVKMAWPADIPVVVGHHDHHTSTKPPRVRQPAEPLMPIGPSSLPTPKGWPNLAPPPKKGTQLRSAMIRMYNEGRPMTLSELSIGSSVFYRALQHGRVIQTGPKTFDLTDEGREVAANLKRDAMLAR